jgi:hypothetical protein
VLVAWSSPDRETVWGRSYVEHLQAIADGRLGPLPAEAQPIAARILAVPSVAPALVVLRGPGVGELDDLVADAQALVDVCVRVVATQLGRPM